MEMASSMSEVMDNVVRIKKPLSAGACMSWAIKQSLSMRATVVSALIVVLSASPLYLLGYQDGALPVIGWMSSGLLGSMALALAVAWREDHRARWVKMAMHSISKDVVLAGGLNTACIALVTWSGLWLMESSLPEIWRGIVTNDISWWWKPMAHVSAMGVLFLAVAPYAMLSLIVEARTGLKGRAARRWVREYLHGTVYDPRQLIRWSYILVLLSFVPIAGILAVPIAAAMASKFYSHAYASK